MRNRITLMTILVMLLVAACGAQAEPTAQPAPAEGQSAAPEAEPQPTSETQPTAETATESEDSGAPAGEAEGDLPPPPEEQGTSGQTFTIVPAESEARFYIDEVLFGNDVTVEGVNNSISGEVVTDYDNLVTTTFRPIRIDANGFVTDNNNRNRAIQRFVLETGQAGNETILFEINNVQGLPEAATIGETYDVTIDGLLTMHGQSNPVTFTGTLTPVSQMRIEGSFSTGEIDYSQWGISVPLPQSVSFVADTLRMEFDFVAEAQ